MDNTKLYFLLSFNNNEYKTFDINIKLINRRKNEKFNLTNIYEIGKINDNIITIGIYDFKNNRNYKGFHIIIKNKKSEYWTEQKEFISNHNNFIFNCIFYNSNNKQFQDTFQLYNLEISQQYFYFCKYIEQQNNIWLFNELNRDISIYLTVDKKNSNGKVILNILKELFIYGHKDLIIQFFNCEIDFNYLMNMKYKELDEFKDVIQKIENFNPIELNINEDKNIGEKNYIKLLMNYYINTESINKIIEFIQNNINKYQFISSFYAYKLNDSMKFIDKNIFYNALNFINKNKSIPKQLFILLLSLIKNKNEQYELIFEENSKLLNFLPNDIQSLIKSKKKHNYKLEIGFILEISYFESSYELAKILHLNLQKYYFKEYEGNYFKEIFIFNLNKIYESIINYINDYKILIEINLLLNNYNTSVLFNDDGDVTKKDLFNLIQYRVKNVMNKLFMDSKEQTIHFIKAIFSLNKSFPEIFREIVKIGNNEKKIVENISKIDFKGIKSLVLINFFELNFFELENFIQILRIFINTTENFSQFSVLFKVLMINSTFDTLPISYKKM